jgi:hypothetical protein
MGKLTAAYGDEWPQAVVERKHPLHDELEHDRGDEGLGDAGDADVIVQLPCPGTQTPTKAPGVEVAARAESTISINSSCRCAENDSPGSASGVAF